MLVSTIMKAYYMYCTDPKLVQTGRTKMHHIGNQDIC